MQSSATLSALKLMSDRQDPEVRHEMGTLPRGIKLL